MPLRLQKQAFRHRPDEGLYGDCHRTCYAVILDVDRDEVPHFYHPDTDTAQAFHDFHRDRGLEVIDVAFPGELPLVDVLNTLANLNPGRPLILGGTSANGVNHSVVALDGEVAWDPSLDDSGIVGPCDDGLYWVTYLVGVLPTYE